MVATKKQWPRNSKPSSMDLPSMPHRPSLKSRSVHRLTGPQSHDFPWEFHSRSEVTSGLDGWDFKMPKNVLLLRLQMEHLCHHVPLSIVCCAEFWSPPRQIDKALRSFAWKNLEPIELHACREKTWFTGVDNPMTNFYTINSALTAFKFRCYANEF